MVDSGKLTKEVEKLKKELKKWETDFLNEHGRKHTEDDTLVKPEICKANFKNLISPLNPQNNNNNNKNEINF